MTTPIPDKKTRTLLQSLGEQFAAKKKRAQERLQTNGRNEWNFAIVGLSRDTPNLELEGIAIFRSVDEPPGEIELAGALDDPSLFGAIGRYSKSIRHELAINRQFSPDYKANSNLAWWLLSGLRIKTGVEVLVPAVADCSWSAIAAIDDRTCKATLIEDVPQSRPLAEPVTVSEEDFRWSFRQAITMGELLEVARFRLAVEALTTHQHVLSPRMMVADIWSGIEALMGTSNELAFRLALSRLPCLSPEALLAMSGIAG